MQQNMQEHTLTLAVQSTSCSPRLSIIFSCSWNSIVASCLAKHIQEFPHNIYTQNVHDIHSCYLSSHIHLYTRKLSLYTANRK